MFRVSFRRYPCEDIRTVLNTVEYRPMKGYGTVLASFVFTFSACQGLPHFSPSGAVRGVTIGDRLSSAAIQVKDGDEIRWTNRLKTPVRIILGDGDYVSDTPSCRNNFSGHFY